MMIKRSLRHLAQPHKTARRPSWTKKHLPELQRNYAIFLTILTLLTLWDSAILLAHAEQTRIAIAVDPEGRTCLIGGGVNGTPLKPELVSKLLKPRQNFRTYNLKGRQSAILWPIGKPENIENDSCDPHIRQQLSLTASEIGKPQIAIYDGGGSKRIAILPKTLVMLNTDNEVYLKVLSNFLEQQGLKDTPAKIHQLIRTDLEGDGKFETIINAINTERKMDRKGEYSIVLVVREVDGKQVVEPIQNEITLEDSNLPVVLWENTIAAIADTDGNGTYEIIMYGQFFHGQGWDLVDKKTLSAERPVICGCGG